MSVSNHPGCILCGHHCRVDRNSGHIGRCGAETKLGFSAALIHHGEEPPLSGYSPEGGSGTIFFTRCNLTCAFCQNWQISQSGGQGIDIDEGRLVELMFQLAENGAHNINLVSPTPYAVEIARALSSAKKAGLNIPVVYNTGGYDSMAALAMLDGLVEVYLPDAKIGLEAAMDPAEPDSRAMRLFGAGDYVRLNRAALLEMKRQVGHLLLDGQGLAARGLMVRHLVLPDDLARTSALLPWLAENIGPELHLSLMAQYHPANRIKVGDNPEFRDMLGLGRPLSIREYEQCVNLAWSLGLTNTYVQDLESATMMRPDFSKPGPKIFN
ncbi:MAG: radical SAM protein [Deltaproteobacteria bacterium]|jgi:putative pyruvate formate lyase activating enzyme|nr:radical SAM protein [Deltaproteobacteria bacterium]